MVRSGCTETDGGMNSGRQMCSSTKTGKEMERRVSGQTVTLTGVSDTHEDRQPDKTA